jgi:hypothetical protein
MVCSRNLGTIRITGVPGDGWPSSAVLPGEIAASQLPVAGHPSDPDGPLPLQMAGKSPAITIPVTVGKDPRKEIREIQEDFA